MCSNAKLLIDSCEMEFRTNKFREVPKSTAKRKERWLCVLWRTVYVACLGGDAFPYIQIRITALLPIQRS